MGKVKNWTVEKKDEIETILIDMWAGLGMEIPDNYEDIVQDCYEDVCETADPINWNNSDVTIAFRRWIEAQAKENVQPTDFEPAMEDKFTECTEALDTKDKQVQWVCTECGGSNVQLKAWVDPNTEEIEYTDGETSDCWCKDCEAHNKLEIK